MPTHSLFSVVDIFCGAGGLSYGFTHSPHFDIKMAIDIDKDAIASYALNHSTPTLCADIATLTESTLLELGKVDILLGGPPCQSYSTLGKRQMDSRANLFREFIRVLEMLKPQIFIFENVKGLLSMQGGKLFDQICEQFDTAGYRLEYQVLNALDFGVPQIRERVILVGIQKSLYSKPFPFPTPTHANTPICLRDALDDLPIIGSGEDGNSLGYRHPPHNEFLRFVRTTPTLSEHTSPRNNPHLIKLMQTLKDGQGKDDLPPHLRPKSGYANTYAKMWWNLPSPTITRNFATPSSSRCIHPRDSRAMSIREGARLQSFPDDYRFSGSESSKRLQIGNAVPPRLSIALAQCSADYLLTIQNQTKENNV